MFEMEGGLGDGESGVKFCTLFRKTEPKIKTENCSLLVLLFLHRILATHALVIVARSTTILAI